MFGWFESGHSGYIYQEGRYAHGREFAFMFSTVYGQEFTCMPYLRSSKLVSIDCTLQDLHKKTRTTLFQCFGDYPCESITEMN